MSNVTWGPIEGGYPRRAQLGDVKAVINLNEKWPPVRWEVATERHAQRLAGEAESLRTAEARAERAMVMMLESCSCNACRSQ